RGHAIESQRRDEKPEGSHEAEQIRSSYSHAAVIGFGRVRSRQQLRLSNEHVNTSILLTLVMPPMRHASRGPHKALSKLPDSKYLPSGRLQVPDPGAPKQAYAGVGGRVPPDSV